ncbi:hypothetical protein K504DRAFT_3790 [Pleomassaria siparia CBS 279.74]|uniref:Uncharacterized protein n=1 Tax=Pleomassaria siparia CBS 279.74 TaxID=1314801 RepID=A0A6G1KP74_9PLEO|nr:hypothetical protein K504DRAFT_3790 [Pleomassaria siparia CBS 279.74]
MWSVYVVYYVLHMHSEATRIHDGVNLNPFTPLSLGILIRADAKLPTGITKSTKDAHRHRGKAAVSGGKTHANLSSHADIKESVQGSNHTLYLSLSFTFFRETKRERERKKEGKKEKKYSSPQTSIRFSSIHPSYRHSIHTHIYTVYTYTRTCPSPCNNPRLPTASPTQRPTTNTNTPPPLYHLHNATPIHILVRSKPVPLPSRTVP